MMLRSVSTVAKTGSGSPEALRSERGCRKRGVTIVYFDNFSYSGYYSQFEKVSEG